ncbi:hypothetical protein BMETH_496_2 [methanotrophic bacterial endosymbiont of Bathymodiolus sp.]|nr:hypothetical protein BMETH_496_2 [methanotrophic bacterial endosymbiont of Bathymodiolus sp.]
MFSGIKKSSKARKLLVYKGVHNFLRFEFFIFFYCSADCHIVNFKM